MPLSIEKKFNKALKVFDEIVFRTRELVRKGRSFERKKRPRKNYSMNYKRMSFCLTKRHWIIITRNTRQLPIPLGSQKNKTI